ncbi:AAA family ATPase [candidate division KSB1 bacterium]|nr:AAA family ATPase [candidate division KSB1 bacterium]
MINPTSSYPAFAEQTVNGKMHSPSNGLHKAISDFNTILPHDANAEKCALGALLGEFERKAELVQRLQPEHFYDERHRKVFAACAQMLREKKGVALITAHNYLKEREQLDEAGGAAYLTEISQSFISAESLELYVTLVEEKAQKRRIFETAHRIAEAASHDRPFESLEPEIASLKSALVAPTVTAGFIDAIPREGAGNEVIIADFAFAGCLTTVAGRSGDMKSLYTQWRLNKSGIKSLYLVNLDMSSDLFFERQQLMPSRSIVAIEINPDSKVQANFSQDLFWSSLAKKVEEHQAKVVVFDTLLDFVRGDYNQASDLSIPLQRCRDFAQKKNIALILLTHTNKASWRREESWLSDVSDSRMVITKSDLILLFQLEKSQNGEQFFQIVTHKNRMQKPAEPAVYEVKFEEHEEHQSVDYIKACRAKLPGSPAVQAACNDLASILEKGRMSASEVKKIMEEQGHTEKITRKAREQICKKPLNEDNEWFWELK